MYKHIHISLRVQKKLVTVFASEEGGKWVPERKWGEQDLLCTVYSFVPFETHIYAPAEQYLKHCHFMMSTYNYLIFVASLDVTRTKYSNLPETVSWNKELLQGLMQFGLERAASEVEHSKPQAVFSVVFS